MSFAKVYSAQTTLLTAHIIGIEVDLSRGLHAFSIVGLPDKAVEESRDRISAAIKNTGFTSPKSKNQKTVVSLAPANIKKEGPIFDVGIALAYLLAAEDISFEVADKMFLGELSLDGEIKPIQGILPLVKEAKHRGFKEVYIPQENTQEGALIDGITVFGVRTLRELIQHLNQKGEQVLIAPQQQTSPAYSTPAYAIDIGDIRGQETAKRGLLIAAAGGHNIALFGPPGTGKTMLARAFTSLLPPLSYEDMLEVTGIHSISGGLQQGVVSSPPFRSPHHTASYVSVVGGGTVPRPGEVTLAHRGVLFLDEFPEFDRRVIESLREPLEEHAITIARAKGTVRFPARFILIAALNPCPCGNFGSRKKCLCTPTSLERYRRKISGPIIDRIDMWIEVGHVAPDMLSTRRTDGVSESFAKRITSARARQGTRFAHPTSTYTFNSDVSVRDIDTYIPLTSDIRTLLNDAALKIDLSPRAYHRIIKLARTIADLEEKNDIKEDHMLEALQYRPPNNSLY